MGRACNWAAVVYAGAKEIIPNAAALAHGNQQTNYYEFTKSVQGNFLLHQWKNK